MPDTYNPHTVEAQVATFLAKYTPALEAQMREARAMLRAKFPRGFELVYDNYNALAIGVSPTSRASDVVVSIAGYPRWVTLFFLRGAELKDPRGLLVGDGARVRSIRLTSPADIDARDVAALIKQAIAPHAAEFRDAPALTTIVKSVSAKQRSRRPA